MTKAFLVAAALVGSAATGVSAAPYAAQVIEYVPGTIRSDYQVEESSLGKTAAFTPVTPFDPAKVVTPFHAPWTPDALTGIGPGGKLVLKLGQTAETGNGFTLGVHAGVNLQNVGGATGAAGDPAVTFSHRRADVRVSFDGLSWVPLASDIVFDEPTNWYSAGVTTPQSQTSPGTAEADFTKPFTITDSGGTRAGQLSDFDGLTYTRMLTLLDGSAGGTWFDLSSVPLPGVNYVEFAVDAGDVQMYVDMAVAVPEPTAAAAVIVGSTVLLLGRRRRREVA